MQEFPRFKACHHCGHGWPSPSGISGALGADKASLFSGLQLQAPCGLQGSLQAGPQLPEQLPPGPGKGVPHHLRWHP